MRKGGGEVTQSRPSPPAFPITWLAVSDAAGTTPQARPLSAPLHTPAGIGLRTRPVHSTQQEEGKCVRVMEKMPFSGQKTSQI